MAPGTSADAAGVYEETGGPWTLRQPFQCVLPHCRHLVGGGGDEVLHEVRQHNAAVDVQQVQRGVQRLQHRHLLLLVLVQQRWEVEAGIRAEVVARAPTESCKQALGERDANAGSTQIWDRKRCKRGRQRISVYITPSAQQDTE